VKDLLAKLVKRLDAMTQRERLFIFVAGAVAIVAVVYVGGIEPALKRRALLEARMNDQSALLATAEAQKRELRRTLAEDPAAALGARIAAKQKEIASIDAQLASLQRTLIAPDRMASVLEELVGRSAQVKLVSLRNLPAAPLVSGKANADVAQAAAAAAHVYRHGVEIVVEGSYMDLLAYVGRIERQSWQVYWGRTVMAAEYPKAQLTLTLYTLSLDRAWLVV
jgi:MSHA biogenesis protein MshJ